VVGQPVDEAADPVELVGVVDRAVEHVLVVGLAGLGALACSVSAATKSSCTAGRRARGSRRAVLAGVEVAGDGDRLCGASTSASSNTMTGALPPSSRCTRLTSSAAAFATSLPARTEPVIATIAGSCG
jgi:hypothetical protein